MVDMWILCAIFFGLYCALSYIFRVRPGLLYSNCRKSLKYHKTISCLHISHRGGAGENLENTMKAFDHAAAIGTDMFEIDCQMTYDGYVVIAHDNHMGRMCGEDILISETNFKDLPPLQCTQTLSFMKNFQLTKNIDEKDRKILLLEELFKKYPNKLINIDIKVHNAKLISAVAKLVEKYQREQLTVWGNQSTAITKDVRALNTDIRIYYNVAEILKTLFLYCTGLLPFVPVYADYMEIPMFSMLLEQTDIVSPSIWSPFVRIIFKFLNYIFTNRKLITHLRKRGVPTFFFVLNTEQHWRLAIDCGAAGIMTDFPSEMKLWMQRNSV